MMGRPVISLAIVSLLLVFSCSRSRKVPSDIIDKDRMGSILFDIGMAEGHLETYYFKDSTYDRDSMLRIELEKVLAIHRVTQSEFRRSYDFYKSHPAIFKVMTDSLQARAQRSQDKMYGKRPKPRRK